MGTQFGGGLDLPAGQASIWVSGSAANPQITVADYSFGTSYIFDIGATGALSGAGDNKAVAAYATCAAAQYTLIRGYGFARHVRTNVTNSGGIWRADAVYLISPALPEGLRTIDAEVTVADCKDQGIPTV